MVVLPGLCSACHLEQLWQHPLINSLLNDKLADGAGAGLARYQSHTWLWTVRFAGAAGIEKQVSQSRLIMAALFATILFTIVSVSGITVLSNKDMIITLLNK